MDAATSPNSFFSNPKHVLQKQYEALRDFYMNNLSAEQIAKKFGYKKSAFYSLARDFLKHLNEGCAQDYFFTQHTLGRPHKDPSGDIQKLIVALRKRYLSVPDIKAVLDVQGIDASETYIYQTIIKDGFGRLPRRNIQTKQQASSTIRIEAPKAEPLEFSPETFSAQNSLGLLCIIPYLESTGILKAIQQSTYPETKGLDRISSILSFVALKLSDVKRYTQDDAWCMDRGLGLFAKLNVLPKAAWFTSYSHRVTRKMDRKFLGELFRIFDKQGLISDTANMDFTAIPYWGDDSHLENNWSGKRNKGLPSILAVLAQDPDSGIITYGDTTVRHKSQSKVVLEFLDFQKRNAQDKSPLRYLVFDSKFTTYENLARLDPDVLFLTIRRRGTNIVKDLEELPSSAWKTIRVMAAHGKGRTLRVNDSLLSVKEFKKKIRQIAIKGNGRIKPALLLTNDMKSPCEDLVYKYARRWLVEKELNEQIDFFHLNRVSSSMVIKVDFDFTMSILSHNVLRLFALDLEGYSHHADQTLYQKFLNTSGSVQISAEQILVRLKKKRNLPAVLTAMESFQGKPLLMFHGRTLCFEGDSSS